MIYRLNIRLLLFIIVFNQFIVFCSIAGYGKGHHPILLFNDEDEEKQIQYLISSNKEIYNIHEYIIEVCDQILSKPMLKYELTGIRLLLVSRESLKRIFYLSYAYRITKQNKYKDRAINEIINVCNFSDWNPNHFLDVAEMSLAVSIGYDWLYDSIRETDRELIISALTKKAILPSFDESIAKFYVLSNNWNSVCNACLLYVAIAVQHDLPELSDQLISRCIKSNSKALKVYNPNGGYPEGCNYWVYGTLFETLLIDLLERNVYKENVLSINEGFLNTAYFRQFMETPSGNCFNFSDSPQNLGGNIPMWWFAYMIKDYSLLFIEEKYSNCGNINISESRLLPLIPIWAARIGKYNIVPPKQKYWFDNGELPIFVYRSGWNYPDDSYLGVKGGSASISHAHMDAGSFIYEYNGVRWAMDLGMQDYNSLERRGVKIWDSSQNGQRWDVMRMRNDCHNTLTIDSLRHNVKARAEIIDTFATSNKKGAIVDLTSTLGKLRKAHREVSLDAKDYLSVVDSIETAEDSILLTWVMVTPAVAEIKNDNTILLAKNGKKMQLKAITSPSISVNSQIWSNEPIHDYDAPNKGTCRVGFTSMLSPNLKTEFKVTLTPIE